MKVHDAIGIPFGGIALGKVPPSGLEPLTPALYE
jgi:hypothetical protein